MRQSLKESFIASLFAYPSLVFLIIPMVNLIRGWDSPAARFTFFALAAFTVIYMASWWVLPVAPLTINNRLRWFSLFGLALVTQLMAWAGSWHYGGAGMMCIYLCAMALYLCPYGMHWKVASGFGLLGLIELLFPVPFPDGGVYLIFGVGTIIFVMMLIRWSMESDRRKLQTQQAEAVAAKNRDRERISADLHDLLGQTLTAISIHAEVARREFQRGHQEAGGDAMEKISELAKSGIADVRSVVTQLRSLDLEEEISQFIHLSAGRGISVTYSGPCQTYPEDEFHQLQAWVTREAGANIWHHSNANKVWIGISENFYVIVDNGTRNSSRVADGGHGLAGLETRARNIATLKSGWLQPTDATGARVKEVFAHVNWPGARAVTPPKQGFYLLVERI